MAHLAPIALGLAIAASPALGQTAAPPASPSYILPDSPDSYAPEPGRIFAGSEVGPNARLGLGMFGLKAERIHQSPATVREIDTPRTRRAGIGFSLKF